MMKNLFFYILFCLSLTCVAQIDSTLQFSKVGGIYQGGLKIELHSLFPEALIFYTTDCTDPNTSSNKYSIPIPIILNTVLKVCVYINGRPSHIYTQTYITDREYSIAIVSISTKPEYLFSEEKGLFMKGCCADSVQPYYHANFWKEWEYPANIEMYEPTGEQAFNQLAGIRTFGFWSRMLPQKSIAVIARKKYGDNKFRYPIFPDRDNSKYKSFVLRNSGSDFNITQFRDAFITNLCSELNVEVQKYKPVAVFFNGQYWGIMNLREKLNEHYLKYVYGVNKDSIDFLNHQIDRQCGNRQNYNKLIKYISTNDFSEDSNMRFLSTWIDFDNYLDYNIIETYIDNGDAGGNIRFWREQKPGKKWHWILFDTDMSFGVVNWRGYKHNSLEAFTDAHGAAWPNPPWSTLIIRKLLENDSLKTAYITHWCDYLNTTFAPDYVCKRITSFHDQYAKEMPFHIERWHSYGNNEIKDWEAAVERLKEFARQRPHYMRQFIMEYFNLTDTSVIHISVEPAYSGWVQFNSVKIDSAFTGIYFDSIPYSIQARPNFGYEIAQRRGMNSENSTMILQGDTNIKVVFRKKALSRYAGRIIISEISCADTVSGNWVELYNNSEQTITIGNWHFSETKHLPGFSVPEGVKLPPYESVILAQDVVRFIKKFSDSIQVYGNFDFGLRYRGEWICLLNDSLQVVDSLFYGRGWKELADSVVYARNNLNNTVLIKNNWEMATPTPGVRNAKFLIPGFTVSPKYVYLMAIVIIFLLLIFIYLKKNKKRRKRIEMLD